MPVALSLEKGLYFLFLLGLVLTLLIWLVRQLYPRLYRFLLMVTGSRPMAMLVLFLLFLPGIALHECTHWLCAWLLRMQPHTLTLWPTLRGHTLEMGSVQMRGAGIWRETLVGLAPLLVGSALIALIGSQVFRIQELVLHLLRLQPQAAWSLLRTALHAPDSALWLYLLFAIGNSMLPSSSDRRSLALVLYYLGLGVVLFVIADLVSPEVTSTWWPHAVTAFTHPLQALNSFLLLVILLDLGLLGLLGLLHELLVQARRRQPGPAR